jgi:hypothetical protein
MGIPRLQDPLYSGSEETYGDAWFQISEWLVQRLGSYARKYDNLEIEFVNQPILKYLTMCLYREFTRIYNPQTRYLPRYYKDLDTITTQADKKSWNEEIWERYLSFHIPDIVFYTGEQIKEEIDSYFANDFLSISPKIIGNLLYNIIQKNYGPYEDSDSESENHSDSDGYYDEYDV